MKNRLFEPLSAEHTTKKNDDYSHDLQRLLGKKVELSLRNQEPVVGVLSTSGDTGVNLLICGHMFMISHSDIVSVRTSL